METTSPQTQAIVITGITDRQVQVGRSLLVKLSVNNIDTRSVVLKRRGQQGEHILQDSLLRNGSMLHIEVQEKHRFQNNKTLARLTFTFNDIWCLQEVVEDDEDPKRYRVQFPDPMNHIWLNISLGHSLENALQELQQFKSKVDYLGRAKDPLETVLKIAEAAAELHPAAKVVVTGVSAIYNELKTQDRHHKEMLALVESMAQTMELVAAVKDVARLEKLKDTIESFPNLVNSTVDFVIQWLKKKISNFFATNENQGRIEELKTKFARFEKVFNLGIVADNAVKIYDMKKNQELEELKMRLGGIAGETKPGAAECLDGTRTNVLSNIENMTKSSKDKTTETVTEDHNIIWVCGAPGSGKSSLSLTIKSRLHKDGRLTSYFRFDRNDATVTTSSALWRRVAYDLADRYPSVLEHTITLLRDNRVNLTSTLEMFTSIIEEPLLKLTDPLLEPPVIIVDALDECGGRDGHSSLDRQTLLKTLERWKRLPKHFRLLVTSREEDDINRVLSPISTIIHIPSGHFLTDEASVEASSDIRTFLEYRFQVLRERFKSLPSDWPGKSVIHDMVHSAAGNFMWATAVTDFISSGPARQRLRELASHTTGSSGMNGLYNLYSSILDISFGNFVQDNSGEEVLRAVLGTIVFSRRPLDNIEYTKLPTTAALDEDMIEFIQEGLYSVLAKGPTLRFVHKSFDDFLLSDECPPRYAIKKDESQGLLAKLCLKTMIAELRFNVCNLETSCLRNADVSDIETRVEGHISGLLSYACCFWAEHLSRTPFDDELMVEVKEMIYEKMLYWFEAMSLLKEIKQVSHSLHLVLSWLKTRSDEEFKDFVRDSHRFIGTFGQPIAQSAAHVYISALPFAPKNSLVARHFRPRFSHILSLSTGQQTNWSSCVFTSEHHRDWVCSITFSPDKKYFASASTDKTICICDSDTGNLVTAPFTGGTWALGAFFDPDGRHVWASYRDSRIIGWDIETRSKYVDFSAGGYDDVIGCCSLNGGANIASLSSWNETVTLWNADTGEQLRELLKVPTRDDFEYSEVSFSPNGDFMAWAGKDDKAIRIWKLVDGSEIKGRVDSQGHTSTISALSFSTTGVHVVSGSRDGTVLVWDTKTGDVIGDPLATGKGKVDVVAYSHETGILVSASGWPGVVTVWNASTQEEIAGLEGHVGCISAISLSQDGRRILTASSDHTIRMWDLGVEETSHVIRTTNIHSKGVLCIVFSPCRKKLASLGRDGTIRVWDGETGEPLLHPIELQGSFHSESDIIFSPDSSEIVVLDGGTLKVWNVYTGELAFHHCLRSDDGRDFWRHPAFLSVDHRLVMCFGGGRVRVWHSENGVTDTMAEDLSVSSPPPENTRNLIEILVLSTDGLITLVRDRGRNPRHYLWSTTLHQALDLAFPDDRQIRRVVFSPDGSLITAVATVSSGEKDTVYTWSTQTGELITDPSVVDGLIACLTFSADNCHIAFAYSSSTSIWVWNTWTGCLISGPWQGHVEEIITLAFSADGERLVSGSSDGQIRIWDTAGLTGTLKMSIGTCSDATFMEDGWIMTKHRELLFWVPKDHRECMFWGRCVEVIGGRGIMTRLDTTRFIYGEKWTECYGEE